MGRTHHPPLHLLYCSLVLELIKSVFLEGSSTWSVFVYFCSMHMRVCAYMHLSVLSCENSDLLSILSQLQDLNIMQSMCVRACVPVQDFEIFPARLDVRSVRVEHPWSCVTFNAFFSLWSRQADTWCSAVADGVFVMHNFHFNIKQLCQLVTGTQLINASWLFFRPLSRKP